MTVIQKNPKTAPQKIIEISKEERAVIDAKIDDFIKSVSADAIIAADPGNFSYVSGVSLPYADQFGTPKAAVIACTDKRTVILPPEWAQLPEDQGRGCEVSAYSSSDGLFTDALISGIAEKAGTYKKIGIDQDDLPVNFMKKLQQALPDAEFICVSTGLKKLRMIKTEAEIRMLENAIRFIDRAAVAALNHSEGQPCDVISYYMWEFAERIRVHIGEFGGSGSGNITAVQGSDMRFLSKNPTGLMKEGNPIRFEATGHHLGYWGSGARTFYIGTPCPNFEADYDKNITLKHYAAGLLKPGAKASDIFESVLAEAAEKNISVFAEAGIGYGVGVTEREAPYLSPNDDTVLEPGMVIVLAVYTYGPNRELICSKDTYEITEDGSRLMSWYKNYDKLYRINGTHARHG